MDESAGRLLDEESRLIEKGNAVVIGENFEAVLAATSLVVMVCVIIGIMITEKVNSYYLIIPLVALILTFIPLAITIKNLVQSCRNGD